MSSEIQKYLKEKNSSYLKAANSPPKQGSKHPVVLGKVIGRFKKDLIARKAKAWDSTKSPSILYSSISLILKFFGRFFLIQ